FVGPHVFARADLDGVQGAVGPAGNHQPLAVDRRHDRRRIIRAADLALDRRPPDGLSRPLVVGAEPVPAPGVVAPAGADHSDDDQIALANRADDAAAVAADAAVFLGQVVLPNEVEILVVTAEVALRAVDVDVPGLRVARGAGPADADRDNGRVKDVE